ncbi:MAG: tetratricopeptide repeat protein [Acidobacteriota bacterium]
MLIIARSLLLALAVALALSACAPKKKSPPPDASARGLTPGAAADYYFLLYQELSRQGQPAQAVPVVEKLIELAPSPELYRDLANLHWGLGDPEKTRNVLQEGLARYPDEKVLHFYMANSYLLQRRFEEASDVLRGYLANHPKDQTASQELGAVLVEAGRFQEALDLLGSVAKNRRTPAMAYYEAKAYAGLGKRKQALDKLRQSLHEDPNLLAAWSELAYLHEQANEYRQAEEAYTRILDLGEDGPEIWIRMIRLALKQKNEAKALMFMEKGPKDRTFLFEAMGLFIDEGYQDGAVKVLERMAQDQPNNADVIFIQAMMAVEKENNLDRAFDLLSRIPKTNPLYDKSLVTRIQLALDTNQFERAAPLVAEGKAAFPDRIEFWFLEGVFHDKQGAPDKAAQVYAEVLRKWPDNVEGLYRYGVAQERIKNRAEAMRVMELILAKDPANADALNFVGYALAEDGRDLDRAVELITRALKANPDSPYYLDSLAWAHFKRGEVALAWEEIQRAVTKPVEDPTIWEHYGDIAKALGHRKEAVKGYRKALEMNHPNQQDLNRRLDELK